ncbi:MAG: DUF535 family protein [Candidatus Thiodiazotropha sp.]
MEKIAFLYTLSNVMSVDSWRRKSQLSPLKYGYLKSRLAYFIMLVLNLRGVLLLTKQNWDQLRFLHKNHPEAVPSVFWPYQCASWGMVSRLESLHSHFTCIADHFGFLRLGRYGQKEIISLNEYYTGMRLTINREGVFLREGMLVLNIYLHNQRLFSIAFSVYQSETKELVAVIGAIQGRRMENITDTYRDITKKFYGIRPRDLMVELFQMFCKVGGIDKILAVKDAERQHNHYFYMFKNKSELVSLDYDQVWNERGGHCWNDEYYELPIEPVKKSINRVIAKKRSMYRNRYQLLDSIERKLSLVVGPEVA